MIILKGIVYTIGSMKSRLYEFYNTGNDAQYSSFGDFWAGQIFKPSESFFITNARLLCRRNAAEEIIGNITLDIKEIREDYPNMSDITVIRIPTSSLISISVLGSVITWSSLQWYVFNFPKSILLSVNNLYALIWKAVSTHNIAPFIYATDDSSPSYSRGIFISSANSGGSWTASSKDAMFETYGTGEIILSGVRPYKEATPFLKIDKELSSYKSSDSNYFQVLYTNWYGQEFQPLITGNISGIKIKIFKSSIAADPYIIDFNIYLSDGNLPTGSSLSNGSLDLSKVSEVLGDSNWYDVPMSSVSLSSSNEYFLTAGNSDSGMLSPYMGWRKAEIGSGNGVIVSVNQGSSWTGDTGKLVFAICTSNDEEELEINASRSYKELTVGGY